MYSNLIIDLMQIIMLTISTVVVMVTTAFKRDHGLISGLTVFGLFASLLTFRLYPARPPAGSHPVAHH